jgi:DNA repair protein RecO (recombination protein O)
VRAPRIYKTEAVVLRYRRLGEADRILTILSRDQGKFDVVAKGVRRPRSHKGGHLEELSHSSMLLAKGRSLDTVTQCELIDSLAGLRSDLDRLGAAVYLAELVDRFTEERQENRQVYNLLLLCLRGLNGGKDRTLTLRYFEMQLLERAGFRPQLQFCASCNGRIDAVVNAFSGMAGGIVCESCRADSAVLRPLSVNGLKVLRHLQTNSYEQSLRLRLDPVLVAEVEDLLGRYLRYVLEHEVRSAAFLHSLRSLPASIPEHRAAPETVLS